MVWSEGFPGETLLCLKYYVIFLRPRNWHSHIDGDMEIWTFLGVLGERCKAIHHQGREQQQGA